MGAGRPRAARRSPRRAWRTTTTSSRSAAAWSATSRASAPPTYQRGVPVVQLPTTLVAQVDSAYGGKTGVDLPEGKNYAGAYHQPAAVLADPAVLATLPPAELAAGWAEVVKTALIAGGPLWERVRRPDALVDADLVLACARTKLAVVATDERDEGRRQVLNLGHTVGHAIETATGYARYRHGEAVGLGLLAALTLSGQPGLRARGRRRCWRRTGCRSRSTPRSTTSAVLAALQGDKKRRGGRVGFVLVEAPGDVRTGRAGAARRRRARSGRVGALMRNRVAVMHGVNLDALDRRPAEHYGGLTFARLEFRIEQFAQELGLEARFFHSNHEGEYVEELHKAPDYADGAAAQPRRVDALRVVDPRRGRARAGCPRSRSTSPTSSTASRSARCPCSRTSAWRP